MLRTEQSHKDMFMTVFISDQLLILRKKKIVATSMCETSVFHSTNQYKLQKKNSRKKKKQYQEMEYEPFLHLSHKLHRKDQVTSLE